jgi:hypothetical protein
MVMARAPGNPGAPVTSHANDANREMEELTCP